VARRCRRGTEAGASVSRRSWNHANGRRKVPAVRSGQLASVAVQPRTPSGSAAVDVRCRGLGRTVWSVSSRRCDRDAGLRAVLLWLMTSVPVRTIERQADRRSRAASGFPAAGQGVPGSPARPTVHISVVPSVLASKCTKTTIFRNDIRRSKLL
jgi:hypothetical protein